MVTAGTSASEPNVPDLYLNRPIFTGVVYFYQEGQFPTMQNQFFLVAPVLALLLPVKPEELKQNISSFTANVKIGKTMEVKREKEPVFRNVICNFSITQAHSTPSSVILAGKVVNNNSGTPTEFVPVFFGSPDHRPHLVALTNIDGEFRFRVRLSDTRNQKPVPKSLITGWWSSLQTKDISEATLYLEGRFDTEGDMISSYTHIHSLREFLKQSAKQKP